MEFLRGSVAESAANTYTEVEIPTPVSRSEKLAMLVWEVQFRMDPPDREDGQVNTVTASLQDRTLAAIPGLNRDSSIHLVVHRIEAGVESGALSDYYLDRIDPGQHKAWAPPFLYAKASMFLAITGVGNAVAKNVQAKIGYTLERVPDALFIAALVE